MSNARPDHSSGERLDSRGAQGSSASSASPMLGVCTRCGATRIDEQIGLEPTPALFIETMVDVFAEVHRVLKDDGTIWINIGDSYSHGGSGSRDPERWPKQSRNVGSVEPVMPVHAKKNTGAKPKDLLGVPWMLAFALRDWGWYLRSDIIWGKGNPMPESVKDRPTRSHEYLFLLSKSESYFYDVDAMSEPVSGGAKPRGRGTSPKSDAAVADSVARKNEAAGAGVGLGADVDGTRRRYAGFNDRWDKRDRLTPKANSSFSSSITELVETRRKRDVWMINSEAFRGAHYAVMPRKLVEPCVLGGSRAGDTVLDPFAGACTVALESLRLGRSFVGIELSEKYASLGRQRLAKHGYHPSLLVW